MTYHGVFVDDEDDVFAEQLSTHGQLEIEFLAVQEPTALARAIRDKQPMLVALDYRLDEAPAGLPADQTFKGSALAQHLRDASIEAPERDFAIVLVSAEDKIRTLFQPDQTAHDLFDRVYVKDQINDQRRTVRRELLSLCAAYDCLRHKQGHYDLAELMSAEPDDRHAIDIQALTLHLAEAKAPHLAVKLILNKLIDRPGPLLDLDDVCAHLGVSLESGLKLAEVLESHRANYRGLFGDAWPRWWSHRVEAFALEVFSTRATGLAASERARLLTERFGSRFEAAISPWSGSEDELVAIACASCRRGIEMRHSVAAFEADLPRFARRRRICWDCVQTDRYLQAAPALVIDEIDASLAHEVRGRARPDNQNRED
ncbi:hypothetical protein [Abyssibacter profundi]|uniref:Uncharacterized protein n=1 Tax=Abyssibacter profundi TaxID=2182787 RepID=A0A363UKU6_9GAMM|nr:hypothetical protein [Abyssibacter profundi]PWN56034.1 hypothetical protein DEH80_09475 [Abyssibacter profundi]